MVKGYLSTFFLQPIGHNKLQSLFLKRVHIFRLLFSNKTYKYWQEKCCSRKIKDQTHYSNIKSMGNPLHLLQFFLWFKKWNKFNSERLLIVFLAHTYSHITNLEEIPLFAVFVYALKIIIWFLGSKARTFETDHRWWFLMCHTGRLLLNCLSVAPLQTFPHPLFICIVGISAPYLLLKTMNCTSEYIDDFHLFNWFRGFRRRG